MYRSYFIVFLCLLSGVNSQFDQFIEFDSDARTDSGTFREKWELLESRINNLSQEAVKAIYPIVTDVMGSIKISRTCFRDSGKLFLGLRKLNSWAIKFIDASSKSVDGLMGLQAPSLGAYDECVENKVFFERRGMPTDKLLFQGKYCNVHVKPYMIKDKTASIIKSHIPISESSSQEKSIFTEMKKLSLYAYYSTLTIGLCVPSGCSKADVNAILSTVSNYTGILVKATRCATKEETKFTSVMIAIITVYSFTGFLVLLGTMIEIYCHYFKKDFENTGVQMLKAFSIMTNFKNLITPSSISQTKCLNGMRFLSLTWVILGHTYMYLIFINHSFKESFLNTRKEFAFQAVVNGSFAVDTFFFISGFLLCYATTKFVKIQNHPFSIKVYIIHRLWRLIPVYAFVVAYEFLKPLTGSGPLFHEIVLSDVEACKYWWKNFLFINNFYKPEQICIPQSWFIAVDTQLYIFALVVLLPLMRWPKVGISIAVLIITGCIFGSGLMSYMRNILPVFVLSEGPEVLDEYHHYLNMNPVIHAPPFFLGLLLGYFVVTRSELKLSKTLQVLGWSASTAVCITVVYSAMKWNGDVRPTVPEIITYSAFCRTAWTLGIAWMTLCCCTGHGGVINYILSWDMWTPLSRLTYIAYLVHVTVLLSYSGNMRSITYLQHYLAAWIVIGNVAVTYAVALAGSMLVESPFSSLEKVIFLKGRTKEAVSLSKENELSRIDLDKNGSFKENNVKNNGYEMKY